MLASLFLHLTFIASVSSIPLPAGEYIPDFSHSELRGRDAAQGYFQGHLYVSPDGTFEFPTINQNGFWRIEKGQVVFAYNGFLGVAFPVPDAELKKKWPTSEIAGHVMKQDTDGSLELANFGVCKGPFFFRKAPRRETQELIASAGKNDDAESTCAYLILHDEIADRWGDMLRIILDPKQNADNRSRAVKYLWSKISPEAQAATLTALETITNDGCTAREFTRIQSNLAIAVSKFGNAQLEPKLLEVGAQKHIKNSILAMSIGASHYAAGLTLLEKWTASPVAGERVAACEALEKLNAAGSFAVYKRLASDTDADVRDTANGAILKLNPDLGAKKESLKVLMKDMAEVGDASMSIIPILGESHSELAAPALESVLASGGKSPFDRLLAAMALGDLGFEEALPALKEVLKPRPSKPLYKNATDDQKAQAIGDEFKAANNSAPLKKAVVEAIWKIEHPAAPTK